MDNDDQAPLMASDDHGGHTDDSLSHGHKPVDAKPGILVVALTFAAGISGLLFGYDTGVISATLVSIGTALSNRPLTWADKSIITSSTSLFALVASTLSSFLADKFGRKHVILYADLLFVAGALIQALCRTVSIMVVGRCIIGVGVGAASFVIPLYLAELAPPSHRGKLVTTNVLFITMGQMIAYITGWALGTFAPSKSGWRWMVGLGALPAVLQAFILILMPETPRWLVKAGRIDAARRVIQQVNGHYSSSDTDAVLKEIELEAREEDEARRLGGHSVSSRWRWLGAWHALLAEGRNRRALAIACLLQGLQQLCGFNSLMYYSATIFAMVGFESPTLTSLTVAVTNFVFTLAALGLIDRMGRRYMLLVSIPFMIVGLLVAAFGFSNLVLGQEFKAQGKWAGQGWASLVLSSIMVYVAAYALGLGNVPWMQSELFPLPVRSLGSGLATATNWTANFAVGLTFLPMMEALRPQWTFVLYAVICGVGYAAVWMVYPETAGLSLEEVAALLDDGWGVGR
ncbi:hypothetical protein CDD82_4172 [Ophiocordyceps australis]|uniref:Major facilitator superfamily (MFS) profile domain-containing protein n=1 Tax=Ophiocordyceps australis TaxID=1399860 RepID=A0A2C5ZU40_9HYPO|nr:hypothetical protein CDD82_4172 [Ophiocordyceps australis]